MTTLALKRFRNGVRATHGGRWRAAGTAELLATLSETLQLWRARAAGRRELLALDERSLHDIGISRAQARQEAAKPFWRP